MEILNVEYAPGCTQLNKNCLDLFLPDRKGSPLPIICYTHGGSWVARDKSDYSDLARSISSSCNVIFANINYQLSSTENSIRFPMHVQDVGSAIVFLYNNASKYNIDCNKIFIAGHSAGANMSMLLALNPLVRGHSKEERESKVWQNIKGVIGISGIYDFDQLFKDNPDYPIPYFSMVLSSSQYKEASPTAYKLLENTNFLVIHSKDDGDDLVNCTQAELFVSHLSSFLDTKFVHFNFKIPGKHYEILTHKDLVISIKEFIDTFIS